MTTFVLEHGDGPQEVTVSTTGELDSLLDEITAEAQRAKRPELPTLYDERGRSLAIGVGDRFSLLAWTDNNSDDDALLSKGDEPVDDDHEVGFFYGNQYSFFPVTALISVDLAREAMRQFITSDTRPTVIRWQNP
jgi:hypothetical protein